MRFALKRFVVDVGERDDAAVRSRGGQIVTIAVATAFHLEREVLAALEIDAANGAGGFYDEPFSAPRGGADGRAGEAEPVYGAVGVAVHLVRGGVCR